MKRIVMALLLVCTLALSACSAGPGTVHGATATLVPGTDPTLPEALAPADLASRETATLYFRFQGEPYLAPEMRTITQSPSQPYELSLIGALLAGPGTRSTDLMPLFPEGTRVLSTVTQGRTLFVTFSQEIMNLFSDEPADWQSRPDWAEEVPLRRELCMQSLVATITENCDVDRVQVLVEQSGEMTGSLRLRADFYRRGGEGLVGPLTREESLLLTPHNAVKVILQLWSNRDWQRLYRYVALTDTATGVDRLSYRDFVTTMENQPMLVSCAVEGGSVSPDGHTVTFTLSAVLRSHNGSSSATEGRILRISRENSQWRVTMSQLTGWLKE